MANRSIHEAKSAAQVNREAVTLNELKRQLGFGNGNGSHTRDPDNDVYGGFSDATIDGHLLRFLKSKHLSTSEALAKLKRRRAFESTLPTITVTPAVVSILRGGAFSILGDDLQGRPILYLNLSDFTLPSIDVDEAQRIVIILLEYMLAKCLAADEERNRKGGGQGGSSSSRDNIGGAGSLNAGGGRPPSSSSSPSSPHQPSAAGAAKGSGQGFVLVVNEDGAPWSLHLPLLRKATVMYSIIAKYYPRLIKLVLVAEASFDVRQGIQAALAGSHNDVTRTVLMVQKSDLPRYMAPSVTPTSLGGSLETSGNSLNFAEAVLRHWYTVTSFIQVENNSGGTAARGARQRPLYMPTPLISNATQFVSLHRAAAMANRAAEDVVAAALSSATGGAGGGGGGGGVSQSSRRRSAQLFSVSLTGGTYTPATAAADGCGAGGGGGLGASVGPHDLLSHMSRRTGTAGDDGLCSELSAGDITFAEDDDDLDGAEPADEAGMDPLNKRTPHAKDHVLNPSGGGNTNAEEGGHGDGDGDGGAFEELQRERQLRLEAEQRLRIAELGVTLDPRNISAVERRLAVVHNELNVLVADVLLRARAARQKQEPPTVTQLLDLTLTALEGAAALPEEVPAMSLAVPHQREPESSTCCSMM